MIRRPPRSTLFPYTTLLPISGVFVSPDGKLVSMPVPNLVVPPADHPQGGNHVFVYAVEDLKKPVVTITADRKSTRLNSSHANISYAVFCLKKKNKKRTILNAD